MTREDLLAGDAEFLILLTGLNETYSQTVHARSSYKADEVIWNAKFADMYMPRQDGLISVDLSKISALEELAETPTGATGG